MPYMLETEITIFTKDMHVYVISMGEKNGQNS